MGERTTWDHTHSDMEEKFQCILSSNYCFGCLCTKDENNVKNYVFKCEPLKKIFQMDCIFLCYLCKRIAHHTEQFIQNVQSNQILLENFHNVMDETLKSMHTQTQPLVNLTQASFDLIELSEHDNCSFEESFVICSRSRSKDVHVKAEMKEDAYMEHLEGEFINDDEFPESYDVKLENGYPSKDRLKVEFELKDIDCKEFISHSSRINSNKVKDNSKKVKEKSKKVKKKSNKVMEKSKKREDVKKVSKDIPKIETINITREQCMEERTRMVQDPKYVNCMYKCENCIKGFNFKGSYDKHMEKHNQCMGDYECDICKQRIDTKDKLVNHIKNHLTRHKCPECGLTRILRMTILDHYAAYHSEGISLSCPHCSKTFTRKLSLRKHVNYLHKRPQRVQCTYCNKYYASKEVLRTHMIVQHSKEISAKEVNKNYACQECGMAFRTPSELKNHSIKHSDSREYYCVECDKYFKTESKLRDHLKIAAKHRTGLPLKCQHCEKRFAVRRNLESHMNGTHLNVKPFACDKCDKAYVTAWGLKEHSRLIHEGYKRPLKFACHLCDKVFFLNKILKAHIRTHTGELPYQCSKCSAQFRQASTLRTHDRLVHLKLTRDGRPKVK